jgi:hypothetical protein
MFSFFKKKSARLTATDIVFANKQAKWQALTDVAKQTNEVVFIGWFEKTIEEFQQYVKEQVPEANIILYRQLHSGMTGNKRVIFIEHYPLHQKEQQIFSSLNSNNIFVYSSLDEAFFKYFGGDNMAVLLNKLGLQENEAISHTMITKAIANAQEKLATKITTDHTAYSMEDWMHKNVSVNA